MSETEKLEIDPITQSIRSVADELGIPFLINEIGLAKVLEEVGLAKVIEEVGLSKLVESLSDEEKERLKNLLN